MVCIPGQGVYCFRRCWQGAIESAFTHILTLSFIRRNCFSFLFLFYFILFLSVFGGVGISLIALDVLELGFIDQAGFRPTELHLPLP